MMRLMCSPKREEKMVSSVSCVAIISSNKQIQSNQQHNNSDNNNNRIIVCHDDITDLSLCMSSTIAGLTGLTTVSVAIVSELS